MASLPCPSPNPWRIIQLNEVLKKGPEAVEQRFMRIETTG